MFDVNIISTGSEGNCVVIDDTIMIDLGLTKKKTETLYGDVDDLLCSIVTHKHADHCSLPLVKHHIARENKLVIPKDVYQKLEDEGKIDLTYTPNLTILPNTPKDVVEMIIGDYLIQFLPQKHHDIINYAVLIHKDGERLLYSTDLDTLDESDVGVGLFGIEGKLDVIILEGNFDEVWLRSFVTETIETYDDHIDTEEFSADDLNTWVRQNYRNIPKEVSAPLFRAVQNMRHLSKQEARKYAKQKLKKDGQYYEVHRSSMFYSEPSEW